MTTLLGGLTPQAFLDAHWQKRALLVRQAIPGFAGFVSRDDLFTLARRQDVVSRLVTTKKARLRVQPGPMSTSAAKLGEGPWSILVQGIEGLVPGGWELLRQFEAIVPRARLDDLMISYATVGGGVGPHTDLYDVFLLQGPGRRRWQTSTQTFEVDDDAEVPSLKNFVAEDDFILEPGDMLYLPPGVAHHGLAVDGPCFTYSIGAVAPSVEGLLQNFLGFLSQKVEAQVDLAAMYTDPDLQAPTTTSPAHVISDGMSRRVQSILDPLRFGPADVDEFLGRLMTGPKPTVVFQVPRRPPGQSDVRDLLQKPGTLQLTLPSRGLRRGRQLFLNGDIIDFDDDNNHADDGDLALCSQLIEQRALSLPLPSPPSDALTAVVTDAIERGFMVIVAPPRG
jgi:50S ribosomal protein L16 3-hydroxylase